MKQKNSSLKHNKSGTSNRFMARKKSIKTAAEYFDSNIDAITSFLTDTAGLKDSYLEWCAELAVIRIYREFENLILDTLVGSINHDADTISEVVGFKFPKQMSGKVCKYLIVGTGYFDFKGRDGLIKTARDFVPDNHWFMEILKDNAFKDAIERLFTFRNFAAHDSDKAKAAARRAIGGERLGTAGSWLRKQNRLQEICASLKKMSAKIQKQAPY